jgi:hypothetical protein
MVSSGRLPLMTAVTGPVRTRPCVVRVISLAWSASASWTAAYVGSPSDLMSIRSWTLPSQPG